jgi:hypothetical protein
VVLKTLFLRQKYKNSFFVVLNSTKILWKSFFENLLKWRHSPRWRIFAFLFSKNQRINIFQFCELICVGKYSYFMAKIVSQEKIQNGDQKLITQKSMS